MSEYYMTVQPESNLYKDYFAWTKDYEKIMDIYGQVSNKFGIETSKFYPFKSRLAIVPTEKDKEKFKRYLLKDGESFRKNSEPSKEWVQAVKDIKFMTKPSPTTYTAWLVGRASSRLFAVGDVLYCSIETEYDFPMPDWGVEMKTSEFYKVIESLEG